MKVVCMTHENFSGRAIVDENHPAIGEIVTVVDEIVTHCDVDCYIFSEYMHPNHPIFIWGFDKRNYSPISDIDERELVNTKEECV